MQINISSLKMTHVNLIHIKLVSVAMIQIKLNSSTSSYTVCIEM